MEDSSTPHAFQGWSKHLVATADIFISVFAVSCAVCIDILLYTVPLLDIINSNGECG